MSETSSNWWKIRVIHETGCWKYFLGSVENLWDGGLKVPDNRLVTTVNVRGFEPLVQGKHILAGVIGPRDA